MAGLNHFIADLYPNQGFTNSRYLSIPEAEDQNTLVDNQELAEEKQVKHDPVQSKSILWAVLIFVAVMVLLSWT
jgi:hypothetical protein